MTGPNETWRGDVHLEDWPEECAGPEYRMLPAGRGARGPVRRRWYYLISFMLVAAPAAAQQWDPDRCLTCPDSRQHFAAGAGIDVAAQLLLPQTRLWQRLAIVATVAAAYELGQADIARGAGLRGRGYGIGAKDWAMGVAGAAACEFVWNAIRPHRRGRRGSR